VPADWDTEEDGDWEAPVVPNPLCKEAPGCGVWNRPTKSNPDYKARGKNQHATLNPKHKTPPTPTTRQGQPKKYISAQRDMMDLKGGLFVFETKMTLDRS